MAITRNSEHVSVAGHTGTWYTIDETTMNGKAYFLMEHETYGDEAACVIVDKQGALVLDDVYNGFDDLHYFLEERQYRLFVDMDGTLAEFKHVEQLETLYEYGYFANLRPMENVVQAIKDIIQNHPEIEVYTLSAYLSDSQHALTEKNQWLDKHLPELDAAHRIFLPCGADKKAFVPGGVRESDALLDDYTHNLQQWEPGKGIKLLNGINHTKGTWQGERIHHSHPAHQLAENLAKAIKGEVRLIDAVVSRPLGLIRSATQILASGYQPYYDKGDLHIFKNPKSGGLKFCRAFFDKQPSGKFEIAFEALEGLPRIYPYRHLMPAEMQQSVEQAWQRQYAGTLVER